jgi:hypothetical protein
VDPNALRKLGWSGFTIHFYVLWQGIFSPKPFSVVSSVLIISEEGGGGGERETNAIDTVPWFISESGTLVIVPVFCFYTDSCKDDEFQA